MRGELLVIVGISSIGGPTLPPTRASGGWFWTSAMHPKAAEIGTGTSTPSLFIKVLLYFIYFLFILIIIITKK